MFDMKLPQALTGVVKAFRTEVLQWVTDEFPMLVLRLVFVIIVFGGVLVFEFQLWIASDFLGALTVIFKVALCAGATFLAWEVCVTYVRTSRFSYTKKLLLPDITVPPPTVQKKKVLKDGLHVPPDESGVFKRIYDGDLSDGDIICLEIVVQDSGE